MYYLSSFQSSSEDNPIPWSKQDLMWTMYNEYRQKAVTYGPQSTVLENYTLPTLYNHVLILQIYYTDILYGILLYYHSDSFCDL